VAALVICRITAGCWHCLY